MWMRENMVVIYFLLVCRAVSELPTCKLLKLKKNSLPYIDMTLLCFIPEIRFSLDRIQICGGLIHFNDIIKMLFW